MRIIGCDFHPSYQQIAMLDTTTGELWEGRLDHEVGEARRFYTVLTGPVRVGMEAVGNSQWFERMLEEQRHELWIGDAAQIRRLVVRSGTFDARAGVEVRRSPSTLSPRRDLRAPRRGTEPRDAGGLGRRRERTSSAVNRSPAAACDEHYQAARR